MKKRLLTLQISLALALLALFVFVPLALAGLSTGSGAWEWVNPSVQGNNVNGISFVNSTTGWAAGSAGLVMKTTDGGTNWTSQIPSAFAVPAYSCHGAAIGSGCGLRGVFFLDASTGWVVGDSGTIWKTTDGGTTWTDQHPNLPVLGGGYDASPPTLRSVHFFNASNGIIVGDSFTFYTSNGGTTWTKGSGAGASSLTSVQMLSASTAVAVGGSGAIYKTINGGASWTAKFSTPTTTSNLSAVSFSTATNGFAVGGDPTGRLLRTTDGGETWQANTTSIPTILTGVAIPGGDKLVTSGYSGNIRKYTVDIWNGAIDTVAAGLATVTSGTSNTLITASVAPSTANVFVGGTAGIVLASADSGSTWSPKAGGTAISYYSSSFVDADYGWMVGKSGTVTRTINGGAAWSSDNSGIAGTSDLYGVDFRTSSLGYAVGSTPGTPSTGVAYKYITGTWSAMTLPAGVSYLSEVKMSDDTHGWAVGEEGVILHTTDGANWTKDVPSATYSLNSVDTTSNTDGWAVGSAPCPSGCSGGQSLKGVILKYNGSDWTTNPVTEKLNVNYFTSIDMVSNLIGYAVGYNSNTLTTTGRIFKTTDGGVTWNEQTSPTGKLISGVSFLNANTGFLVADEGRVAKTTNGGTNWAIENAGTDVGLNSVSVISAANTQGYVTYVAGGNSAILKFPSMNAKAITSFTVPSQVGGTTINESAHTISLTMPYGTNVTALVPTITTTGASVNPASGVAHNFTTPQTYTVTAADASTQDYTVTVTFTLNPAKAITSFTVPSQVGGTTINESAHTISLTMPYGTNVTALVPTITTTGASVNPASGVGHNFTSPSTYTVTAADASTQAYTVTVTLAPNPAKAITAFTIPSQMGATTINEGAHTVALTLPYGTNVTALVPTITTTGASVNPASGVGHNFTSPSTYTVTAADASTQDYTVTVSIYPTPPKNYYWTWYDNYSSMNWVLMANPAGALTPIFYQYKVGSSVPTLWADATPEGTIAAGGSAPSRFFNATGPNAGKGMVGGPVTAASQTGDKAIASQRSLWKGGNSLEEVLGTEDTKQSSHYYWTWYDNKSPGTYNWVMVSNPSGTRIYYRIKVGGSEPAAGLVLEGASSGFIEPGQSKSARFNMRTGPVEVETWTGSIGGTPTDAIASQRVLTNMGTPSEAFNEVPGIRAGDLTNDYLWTWYDNVSPGAFDWVLIANPGASSINYRITVKGNVPSQMIEGTPTGTIAPGSNVTPRIANTSNGPLEVKTCLASFNPDGSCPDGSPTDGKSIASQRTLWGPSFEEVPGSPKSTLGGDYHWTWYDQYDAGTYDWIHIINTTGSQIYYQITVGGVAPSPVVEGFASGIIPANDLVHPRFLKRGGPVEVKSCSVAFVSGNCPDVTPPPPIMTSQRVLWHGYFNEVLGSVLN